MFEMGSTAVLFWGMLFGAIGFGFFLYGRKKGSRAPHYWDRTLCRSLFYSERVRASSCWTCIDGDSIFCENVKPPEDCN